MPIISEAITVLTPVEKVFNYLSDPHNLLEFWPSLVKLTNIKSLPDGGYSARYEYKMIGRIFKGTGEYSEIVPNKSFVINTKGGISSILTWTFRSQDSRARVMLTVEYKIPILLISNIAEAIVSKMNEQELALVMSNLRARFMMV
ncbi:SRPBCC family protein [Chloroflexota bacterium]